MEHHQQRPTVPQIDIEPPVGKPPSQFFADIAKNTNCEYLSSPSALLMDRHLWFGILRWTDDCVKYSQFCGTREIKETFLETRCVSRPQSTVDFDADNYALDIDDFTQTSDGSGSIDRDEFLNIPQIASNPLASRMIAIFDSESVSPLSSAIYTTASHKFSIP
jgi:hypothetical protein